MSRKANHALVGGFVLGAAGLLFLAALLFGGGRLLQSKVLFVAYFDGSVRGLSIGAPVTIHGVRVGSVTDVQLEFDPVKLSTRIPVYMEFEKSKLVTQAGILNLDGGIGALVERGLRAQLQTQSFVTGQLLVDLDFNPGALSRTVGRGTASVPEIPTIRSDLEDLRDRFASLPIEELANRMLATIQSVDRLLNGPQIPTLLGALAGGAVELQSTLAEIRNEVNPLTKEANAALSAIRTAAEQASGLVDKTRGTVGEAGDLVRSVQNETTQTLRAFQQTSRSVDAQLAQTTATLKTALRQIETLAGSANSFLAPNTPPHADIEQTLRNLAQATRALRGLAEQLERNPNALILGKR